MPMFGTDSRPATEAVLTTWQSASCRSMMGRNTRTPWITPQTLTPSTHSQSATVFSHTTPPGPTPALLHSRCTAPKVASVFSASRSMSCARDTSVRMPITGTPALRNSVSTLRRASSSMSASTSFMPSAAKRRAMASPSPLAPPVMTATLSLKSFI